MDAPVEQPPDQMATSVGGPSQMSIVMMRPDATVPPLRPGERMDVSGPGSVMMPSPIIEDPSLTTILNVDDVRDCRAAGTRAEQMVCLDPALAAADRRLIVAYRNLDNDDGSSVSRDGLRWLAAREATALTAHQTMLNLYQRRITEVEALGAKTRLHPINGALRRPQPVRHERLVEDQKDRIERN